MGKLIHNHQYVKTYLSSVEKLLQVGGSFHIETGLLICHANQWIGFYMIGTFVTKELLKFSCLSTFAIE